MLRKIFLLCAVAIFVGCSGVPQGTGPGPGGQNATLTVTMTSKPNISLANVSILSAAVSVTGVTLNPSSGSPVSLTLNPTVLPVDLTRLQSDSALLGTLSLPAQTYSSATVTFSAPVVTVDNQSGATLNGTCASGTICQIVLAAGTSTINTAPFPLTLASAQVAGVSINVDLSTALTLASDTVALNFSAINAATATTLPRSGTASGTLDLIEDLVGKVTAVSSNAVTVLSSSGVSQSFAFSGTPVVEDPQGLCTALNATCLVANQTVVSVDAAVNTDGSLTLNSVDLLDAGPQDELEGTLLRTATPGQFFLVVANKIVASGNSTLAAAVPGDIFLVTLGNASFIVDTDEFFNNASLPSSTVNNLFTSEADLLDGQDVMVHVTAAAGGAATNDQSATTDRVRLRFTRTTGTVQSVSGQAVTLATVPPFIPLLTNPQAETINNATNFEGVTDANSLAFGQAVSIRALLLNNSTFNFYAAKVRVQP
ncbi:MAG TPA: DUF5666 domain-containing protein [Candidatus Acidoferrum sp.]